MEKLINPKTSIYLFHQDSPKGEMFNFQDGKQSEEYEAMLEKGWVDTPAKLDLPEDSDTGVTQEQATNARPEDLVKLVTSYGFIVLTPEQLKAEANKMASVAMDIEKLTDEALIAEAERRGLKDSTPQLEAPSEVNGALWQQFEENPTSLNKEELAAMGNDRFSLSLRSNMKEETLINKITEALNNETSE